MLTHASTYSFVNLTEVLIIEKIITFKNIDCRAFHLTPSEKKLSYTLNVKILSETGSRATGKGKSQENENYVSLEYYLGFECGGTFHKAYLSF